MSSLPAMSFNSQTALIGLDQKRRGITLLMAWVLLMPACSFAVLGDAPAIPILAAIPLLISILSRNPIPATTRSFVYAVTISAVVAVFLRGLYPIENDLFFLPAVEALPFLTGVGIAATYFRQTPPAIAVVLSCSILTFMLQGSSLNDPNNNHRLVLHGPFWRDRYSVFSLFLLLHMAAFIPLLRLAQIRARPPAAAPAVPAAPSPRTGRRVAYSLSLLLAISLMLLGVRTTNRLYDQMDRVFSPIYSWVIREFGSRNIFPSDRVSLSQTLDPKTGDRHQRIALRVIADRPPGYLRGRAYTVYENGTWSADDADTPLIGRSAGTPTDNLVAQRFTRPTYQVEDAEKLTTRIDLYSTSLFYSDVLVVPGDAAAVELITDSLQTNGDGVLRPRRWDRAGAYTAYLPDFTQASAYSAPNRGMGVNPQQVPAYTQIPDNLRAPLTHMADAILGSDPLTPTQTITRIRDHIRENHTYTLTASFTGDTDPVLQFLTLTHQGHCEYFATATALLLRARGIPTRYVTGFVCFESSPVDRTWTSRFSDCHAWVEAYDRRSQTWTLVEATPAAGIDMGAAATTGTFALLRERLAVLWGPFYARVKRGYIAEAIYGSIGSFTELFVWLYYTGPWYLSWPLTLLPIALLLHWLHRRRRRPRARRIDTRRDLVRYQRGIDRLLLRYHIRRRPTDTLRDLTRTLHARDIPDRDPLIHLIHAYERLRYHPTPPTPDAIAAFDTQMRALSKR